MPPDTAGKDEFVSKQFLVGGASYTSPHFQRHSMSQGPDNSPLRYFCDSSKDARRYIWPSTPRTSPCFLRGP